MDLPGHIQFHELTSYNKFAVKCITVKATVNFVWIKDFWKKIRKLDSILDISGYVQKTSIAQKYLGLTMKQTPETNFRILISKAMKIQEHENISQISQIINAYLHKFTQSTERKLFNHRFSGRIYGRAQLSIKRHCRTIIIIFIHTTITNTAY